MTIIVGLGNPGKQYEETPHNAGFLVIDALSEMMQSDERFESLGAERHVLYTGGEWWFSQSNGSRNRIVLTKPQTFMNESGKAVRAVTRNTPKDFDLTHDLIVIHDEGDIMLGNNRIDCGKRSAGHRGAESIIQELGTKEFTRVRVGIRPSDDRRGTQEFVLKKLRGEDKKIFHHAVHQAAEGIILMLDQGFDKAQGKLNRRQRFSKSDVVRGTAEKRSKAYSIVRR